MNKLNAGQKKGVQEFVAVTRTTNTNAIKYLKKFAWNLQAAVTDFLEHPPKSTASSSSGGGAFSESTLETFFQKYQSEETKKETATDKKEIDAEESCGSSTI
jgi:hypothetical protein